MLKRVRWMVVGMVTSAGAQVWAKRKLTRFLHRYSPPQVASRAAATAKGEFRAALEEGRTAMRRREAELRGEDLAPTTAAGEPRPNSRNGERRR